MDTPEGTTLDTSLISVFIVISAISVLSESDFEFSWIFSSVSVSEHLSTLSTLIVRELRGV